MMKPTTDLKQSSISPLSTLTFVNVNDDLDYLPALLSNPKLQMLSTPAKPYSKKPSKKGLPPATIYEKMKHLWNGVPDRYAASQVQDGNKPEGQLTKMARFYEDYLKAKEGKPEDVSLGAKTAAAFHAVYEVLREWFKNIYDLVINCMPSMETVEEKALSFFQIILDLFYKLWKGSKNLWDRFAKCIMSYFSSDEKMTDNTPGKPETVTTTTTTFTLDEAQSMINDVSKQKAKYQDQGGESDESMSGKFYDLWDWTKSCFTEAGEQIMTSVFAVLSVVTDYVNVSPGEMFKKFRDYLGIACLFQRLDFMTFLKKATNWVYHFCTGKHWFTEYETEAEFTRLYNQLSKDITDAQALKNPSFRTCREIAANLERIEKIYLAFLTIGEKRTHSIKNMYDKITSAGRVYLATYKGSMRRIKPVSICMFGKAACGKTESTKTLVNSIMSIATKLIGPDAPEHVRSIFEDHSKQTGSWSVSCVQEKAEYDEGYQYQLAYLLEELYSAKNQEICEAWSRTFFELIDEQPLLLNTAFGDKGTKFFDSPFVFATGNRNQHKVSMEDPTAYFRRLDFDWRVARDMSKQGGLFETTRFQLSNECRKVLSDRAIRPHDTFEKLGWPIDGQYKLADVIYLAAFTYVHRITINEEKKISIEDIEKHLGFVIEPQHNDFIRADAITHLPNTNNYDIKVKPAPPRPQTVDDAEDFDFDIPEPEPSIPPIRRTINLGLGNYVDQGGDDGDDLATIAKWLRFGRSIHHMPLCFVNALTMKKMLLKFNQSLDHSLEPLKDVTYNFTPGSTVFDHYAKLRMFVYKAAQNCEARLDGDPMPTRMTFAYMKRCLKIFSYACNRMCYTLINVIGPKDKQNFQARSYNRETVAAIVLTWTPAQVGYAYSIACGPNNTPGWLPHDKDDVTRAKAYRDNLMALHLEKQRKNRERTKAKNAIRDTARREAAARRNMNAAGATAPRKRGRKLQNAGKLDKSQQEWETDRVETEEAERDAERREYIESEFGPKDGFKRKKGRKADQRVGKFEDQAFGIYCSGNDPQINIKDLHADVQKMIESALTKSMFNFHWTIDDVVKKYWKDKDVMICLISKLSGLTTHVIYALLGEIYSMEEAMRIVTFPRTAHRYQWMCHIMYCEFSRDDKFSLQRSYKLATEIAINNEKYHQHYLLSSVSVFTDRVFFDWCALRCVGVGLVGGEDIFRNNSTVRRACFTAGQLIVSGVALYAIYKLLPSVLNGVVSFCKYMLGYEESYNFVYIDTTDAILDILNSTSESTGIKYYNQSGTKVNQVPKENKSPQNHAARFAKKFENQSGGTVSIANYLEMNSYWISSRTGQRIGNLTFIVGTIALVNTHVLAACGSQINLHAFKPTQGSKPFYQIDLETTTRIHYKDDLSLIIMPQVRQHKDICKRFVPRKVAENCPETLGSAIVVYDMESLTPHTEPVSEVSIKFTGSEEISDYRHVRERVYYTWNGCAPGVCGSFLFGVFSIGTYILGNHTAGNNSTNTGISQLITYEMVQDMLKKVPVTTESFGSKISIEDKEVAKGFTDQAFYDYDYDKASYQTPIRTSACGKSVFVPTPFLEAGGIEGFIHKNPAVLDKEAYTNARAKEATLKDKVNLSSKVFTILREHGTTMTGKYVGCPMRKLRNCRMLTFHEAMYGYKTLQGFDLKTSRGIRLRMLGIDKKNLVDPNHPDTLLVEKLVNWKLEQFRKGKFTRQMNVDSLKDELRDDERVKLKKTRCFNITDFVDNILIKMFVGDLVEKMKSCGFMQSPAMCGINVTSSIWKEIFHMFGSDFVLATDISGYDYTHPMYIIKLIICPFLVHCYGGDPRSFEARCAMWAVISCVESIRFCMGVGRRLDRGNTSGNWITTWLNTFVNCIYHDTCVVDIAQQHGIDPVVALKEFVKILYSDDNVSKNTILGDHWNIGTFSAAMQEMFSVIVTLTNKSTDIDGELRYKIGDVDFLSRCFESRGGIVYAPLHPESLFSQLYYVKLPKNRRTTANILEQLQINLDNVSRELVEYEPEAAKRYAALIKRSLRAHEIPCVLPMVDYDDNHLLKMAYY